MTQWLNHFMNSSLKWAVFLPGAATFYLYPVKTDKVIFKNFSKAVTIQSSKAEPPRIAFNEIKQSVRLRNVQELKPGNSVDLNEQAPQRNQATTLALVKFRQVAIQPVHISRQQIIDQKHEEASWLAELTPEQRRRVVAAHEKSQTLEQDWKLPTWQEQLAQQLQEVKVSAGTSVGGNDNSGRAAANKVEAAATAGKKTVSGQVVLRQGLGVAAGDYIDVRYVKDRVAIAAGTVRLPKNIFSIEIPEMSGQVIATLFRRDGTKMGEGALRLSQITQESGKQNVINIEPMQTQVALNNLDFDKLLAASKKQRDYGDRGLSGKAYFASLDTEVNTDTSGVARLENVAKGSFVLVRSESSGYYPSLNLVNAGAEVQRPSFREKFIEALISINRDAQLASTIQETNSVIWGQVKVDGKPQAGVKVEPEMTDEYQIVYFNSWMIPDPKLAATSDNGYYAILHLPEGFYSLLATRGDQYFGHANVQAEPGSVFVADLESSLKKDKVDLKIYDAFTGVGQKASVELQSMAEPILVDGVTELYLSPISRLSLAKTLPMDQTYLPTTAVYSDTDEDLLVPLVKTAWVRSLQQQQKISLAPDQAVVVGFVSGEDFDVFLSHQVNYPKSNIVYFDNQGRVVEHGVAGGGFIAFNVDPGTQSVVSISKATNVAFSQVVPLEPGSVAVLKYDY